MSSRSPVIFSCGGNNVTISVYKLCTSAGVLPSLLDESGPVSENKKRVQVGKEITLVFLLSA
jgi:hypothetical protein